MRAKFGSDPTAGSKILSFKFISRYVYNRFSMLEYYKLVQLLSPRLFNLGLGPFPTFLDVHESGKKFSNDVGFYTRKNILIIIMLININLINHTELAGNKTVHNASRNR